MPTPATYATAFAILGSVAILLGLLSWMQGLLVPIALAVFLAFLLSPPVTGLERRGMPRGLAVPLMLAVSGAVVAGVIWTVVHQLGSLVDAFPQYEQNLAAKLAALHGGPAGVLDRLGAIVERIGRQIEPWRASSAAPVRALPVRVVDEGAWSQLRAVWEMAAPVLQPLATAALALLLTLFMLLRRDDLLDRLITLAGRTRLVATTRMLDEAGVRISRYLLAQLIVNASFGLVLAAGLAVIGVPYGPLWGLLSALLRYVPYVGTGLACLVTLALTALTMPGWAAVAWVLLLFAVVEGTTNLVAEPLLYSRSVGLSETATIVMIAFWTWLWGPVGLLLATPLAACLAVLGAHLPFLRTLDTLLGDRPVLSADLRVYQRLLARDEHDAAAVVVAARRERTAGATLDAVLVPTLARAHRDALRQALPADDLQSLVGALGRLGTAALTPDAGEAEASQAAAAARDTRSVATAPASLLALDAGSEGERLLGQWLAAMLPAQDWQTELAPAELLVSEAVALASARPDAALLVTALAPGGLPHAQLMCLRLKAAHPDRPLVVLVCGARDAELDDLRRVLNGQGAEMARTLDEAAHRLQALRSVRPELRRTMLPAPPLHGDVAAARGVPQAQASGAGAAADPSAGLSPDPSAAPSAAPSADPSSGASSDGPGGVPPWTAPAGA